MPNKALVFLNSSTQNLNAFHFSQYQNSFLAVIRLVAYVPVRDTSLPGDYRILLGETFKDDHETAIKNISVKYNWIPKNGFQNSFGTIKTTGDDVSLNYEHGHDAYDYDGWVLEEPDHEQLALVWNAEKSAFILEKLDLSLEVNIQAGTNITSEFVKRHGRLERQAGHDLHGQDTVDNLFATEESGNPDASNPFDFRHFLEEAKEATEKAGHRTGGGRTPVPGARTPMSGLSSPLLGAGHHPLRPLTPAVGSIEIIDATDREMNEYPDRRRQKALKPSKLKTKVTRKPASFTKAKGVPQSHSKEVLSSEKVIDSDSDSDASDRPSIAATVPRKTIKTQNRKRSSGLIPSKDKGDDSDPDMDSSSAPKASHTPQVDVEMPDIDDENMKYFQDIDDEAENDGDVDELILDEPTEPTTPPPPPPTKELKQKKRRQSSTSKAQKVKAPSPSPPLLQHDSIDEDDLAAELEAELAAQQEGDDSEGGIGLGIGIQQQDDDESDISEEE
ncbi:hypothetical protein LTR64_008095 [Lithohypha guttulata]|uniref:uncharacterized protein n=1 Tax=Lithohypha guttulata TaxID=1690604 RepID=UPI002DE037FC|nr:hypothetical protein LTR51_008035 [Lithohypha guttulata]